VTAYVPAGRTVAKVAVPIEPDSEEQRQKNGKRWEMRSTSTRDPQTVKRMQAMVAELGRFGVRAWDLLGLVTRREWTLMQLFVRYERHRGDVLAIRADLDDVDLAPLMPEFLEHVRGRDRSADTIAHYTVYLTKLGEAGIRRRSQLTVPTLSRWVDTLEGTASTRRKYAAGVSAFCSWLVRRGLLASNPMRDVLKPPAGPGRVRFLEEADMLRLVEAQPAPYRELSALIHGTALDVSAALHLPVASIDLAAWGITQMRPKSKTPHTLHIADWSRPFVRELVRGKLPRALVGDRVSRFTLSDVHRATCAALGIEDYWLRDARHSWSVRFLKMGGSAAQGAAQLGHRDGGVQFLRTYARYVVDVAEREAVEARAREAREKDRHRHSG
jgi:integrase